MLDIGFSVYQFHDEEKDKGALKILLDSLIEGKITSNHKIYHEDQYQIQNSNYNPPKPEDRISRRSSITTPGPSAEPEQKKQETEKDKGLEEGAVNKLYAI